MPLWYPVTPHVTNLDCPACVHRKEKGGKEKAGEKKSAAPSVYLEKKKFDSLVSL